MPNPLRLDKKHKYTVTKRDDANGDLISFFLPTITTRRVPMTISTRRSNNNIKYEISHIAETDTGRQPRLPEALCINLYDLGDTTIYAVYFLEDAP